MMVTGWSRTGLDVTARDKMLGVTEGLVGRMVT
jgi:hypothetical protein